MTKETDNPRSIIARTGDSAGAEGPSAPEVSRRRFLQLMGASIASGAGPSPGRPELLFAPQGDEFTLNRGYAVAPDSQRLLVVREFGTEANDIVLLQNWRAAFSELTESNQGSN